ncbi:MAG: nucleotidyl transferase AbiEii/AbiGii toxin family protein [Bacteroidota bacterium]
MDYSLVQSLSSTLKISPNQLLREYWEVIALKELSTTKWSSKLIFKGGTALRLAYNSPRYSDDLDFSLAGSISSSHVFDWARRFAGRYELRITDQWRKYYTLLIEFLVRDELIALPFRMKLEISTRKPYLKRKDWEVKLLTSPTTNLEVLFQVTTLERIYLEKLAAMKDREEPRDLFDLWYVAQKLKKQLPKGLPKVSERMLRQTLNKYLPIDWRPVINELATR